MILGSVLRRAMAYLLAERELRYDPERPAALNDLTFDEIARVPSRPFDQLKYSWIERLYPHANEVKLKNELARPGPCVSMVATVTLHLI